MWALCAGLALAGAAQLVGQRPAAAASQGEPALPRIPPLHLTTVQGQALSLADLTGKVVLVNIWATWCGPCKAEIPALVELQAKYANQLQIVGLAYDEATPRDIAAFADRLHMNYPVAIIEPADADQFGRVDGIPMSFLADRTGHITHTYLGMLNPTTLERDVRALF